MMKRALSQNMTSFQQPYHETFFLLLLNYSKIKIRS